MGDSFIYYRQDQAFEIFKELVDLSYGIDRELVSRLTDLLEETKSEIDSYETDSYEEVATLDPNDFIFFDTNPNSYELWYDLSLVYTKENPLTADDILLDPQFEDLVFSSALTINILLSLLPPTYQEHIIANPVLFTQLSELTTNEDSLSTFDHGTSTGVNPDELRSHEWAPTNEKPFQSLLIDAKALRNNQELGKRLQTPYDDDPDVFKLFAQVFNTHKEDDFRLTKDAWTQNVNESAFSNLDPNESWRTLLEIWSAESVVYEDIANAELWLAQKISWSDRLDSYLSFEVDVAPDDRRLGPKGIKRYLKEPQSFHSPNKKEDGAPSVEECRDDLLSQINLTSGQGRLTVRAARDTRIDLTPDVLWPDKFYATDIPDELLYLDIKEGASFHVLTEIENDQVSFDSDIPPILTESVYLNSHAFGNALDIELKAIIVHDGKIQLVVHRHDYEAIESNPIFNVLDSILSWTAEKIGSGSFYDIYAPIDVTQPLHAFLARRKTSTEESATTILFEQMSDGEVQLRENLTSQQILEAIQTLVASEDSDKGILSSGVNGILESTKERVISQFTPEVLLSLTEEIYFDHLFAGLPHKSCDDSEKDHDSTTPGLHINTTGIRDAVIYGEGSLAESFELKASIPTYFDGTYIQDDDESIDINVVAIATLTFDLQSKTGFIEINAEDLPVPLGQFLESGNNTTIAARFVFPEFDLAHFDPYQLLSHAHFALLAAIREKVESTDHHGDNIFVTTNGIARVDIGEGMTDFQGVSIAGGLNGSGKLSGDSPTSFNLFGGDYLGHYQVDPETGEINWGVVANLANPVVNTLGWNLSSEILTASIYQQNDQPIHGAVTLSNGYAAHSSGLNIGLTNLEGSIHLDNSEGRAALDLTGTVVRLVNNGETYDFTYSGELILEKDFTPGASLLHQGILRGSFGAYKGPSRNADTLLGLINRGELIVSIDTFDWNSELGRPEQILGTLKLNIDGVEIDRYLAELSDPKKELIKQWFKKQPLQMEFDINWSPQLLEDGTLPPLDLNDGLDIENLTNDETLLPDIPGFNMEAIQSPMDLIQPAMEEFLAAQNGFITTQKATYNSDYYQPWNIQEGCLRDLRIDIARNEWVLKQQKRMRKNREGVLLFGGRGGIYRTDNFDFKIKKNTRADFWVTQSKENPTDEFGKITSVDLLFSKPLCVRIGSQIPLLSIGGNWIPIASLNGIYVDLEKGTIKIDMCPWPDNAFSSKMTRAIWEKTPEELRSLLERNGFNENFPADLEVWFRILSEIDITQLDFTGGESLDDMMATGAVGSEDTPAEEQTDPRLLNGHPFANTNDLPPIHVDMQLALNREVDFKFARMRFECADGICRMDEFNDPTLHRVVADIDYPHKKVTLDLPNIRRFVMESDDQSLILEGGSAKNVVFEANEGGGYQFTADQLGVESIQYGNLEPHGQSYTFESYGGQTTFTNVRGTIHQVSDTQSVLDCGLDFAPAEQLAIRLRGEKRELSIALKDEQRGVTGRFDTQLQVNKGEEMSGVDLATLGINLQIPNPTVVTLGLMELRKIDGINRQAQLMRQISEDEIEEGTRSEISFTLSEGELDMTQTSGQDIPQTRFTGHVQVDFDEPISTEQTFAQGITTRLQSERLTTDFYGELLINDNELTVSALNEDKPIHIVMEGGGEIDLDTRRVSTFPEAAPDIIWMGQMERFRLTTDLTRFGLKLVPDTREERTRDHKPQLQFLELKDLDLQIEAGASDLIVHHEGIEVWRNTWDSLAGSNVHIRNFSANTRRTQDMDPEGIVGLHLQDTASSNRINASINLEPGNTDEPSVQIFVQDPEKKNTLNLTWPDKH